MFGVLLPPRYPVSNVHRNLGVYVRGSGSRIAKNSHNAIETLGVWLVSPRFSKGAKVAETIRTRDNIMLPLDSPHLQLEGKKRSETGCPKLRRFASVDRLHQRRIHTTA